MKTKKKLSRIIIPLGFTLLFLICISYGQFVPPRQTVKVYTNTQQDYEEFVAVATMNYNWSCNHLSSTYSFAIASLLGPTIVWVAPGFDHDTSGIVQLEEGHTYRVGTDPGPMSPPGTCICVVTNQSGTPEAPQGP